MKKSTTFNPEQLRQTMRRWSSGVTIVTAAYDGTRHGMTVSSFTSVSLEPPLIIVSLQVDSRTYQLITKSEAFAVTILSSRQQDLSNRFAGRIPDTEDRFDGVKTDTLVTGAPLIKDGLAYLDCRVSQTIPIGANCLFLAEVVAVRSFDLRAPLIYHDGEYYSLLE